MVNRRKLCMCQAVSSCSSLFVHMSGAPGCSSTFVHVSCWSCLAWPFAGMDRLCVTSVRQLLAVVQFVCMPISHVICVYYTEFPV